MARPVSPDGFQRLDGAGRVVVPVALRGAFLRKPLRLVDSPEDPDHPRLLLMSESAWRRWLSDLNFQKTQQSDPEMEWEIHNISQYVRDGSEPRAMDDLGRVTLGAFFQEVSRLSEWYRVTGNPEDEEFVIVWAKEVFQGWRQSIAVRERKVPPSRYIPPIPANSRSSTGGPSPEKR